MPEIPQRPIQEEGTRKVPSPAFALIRLTITIVMITAFAGIYSHFLVAVFQWAWNLL